MAFDIKKTVEDIIENGVKVGEADNMFIPHEFDVSGALKISR